MKTAIAENRAARKYSFRELGGRVFWAVGRLMFRFSPRICYGFRAWLLRRFGARVGVRTQIYPSVRIFLPWMLAIGDETAIGDAARIYNLGPVTIGDRVTISQGAHICAGSHDYMDPAMPLLRLPIRVEDDAWVCADAYVGPGVTVEEGAVIGARAVVVRDVAAWTVVVGNPAKVSRNRKLKPAQQ